MSLTSFSTRPTCSPIVAGFASAVAGGATVIACSIFLTSLVVSSVCFCRLLIWPDSWSSRCCSLALATTVVVAALFLCFFVVVSAQAFALHSNPITATPATRRIQETPRVVFPLFTRSSLRDARPLNRGRKSFCNWRDIRRRNSQPA